MHVKSVFNWNIVSDAHIYSIEIGKSLPQFMISEKTELLLILSSYIKIINLITSFPCAQVEKKNHINGILKTYLQRLSQGAYLQILDFAVKGANGSG